ncbi:n-terminal acyltransferase complex subunit ard1 [Gigaspora margarita]|uniref:N-terminal acyltransferase complex subunit ard1 n=1 Tax=Gigaspora margarita TaxID=4874 RepID=A0A8H4AB39_GIGMA|nr:n-terminal acyltransferase complex subunit ard1 [Gigaspora margarita]
MLPEHLQITVFPTKSLIKYQESIIHQIETMERKTFPKNEIMAIKEEIAKNPNTLLIVYHLSTENEKQKFKNTSNKEKKEKSERKNDISKKHKVIKIFGYLIYSHISLSISPVTRILKLCIHPSSRRNGLGRMLLEYAIKKTGVPQKSRANLYVDMKRLGAINLYQKVGFKIKDQIKDYYEIGRDAWFMELS